MFYVSYPWSFTWYLEYACCNVFIVTRLEEKDVEAKTEYAKLHERYTDVG